MLRIVLLVVIMSRYIVLPANASFDVYPENSNNNFKIKLPERLSIRAGEFEIALRSITYPNNWCNVKDSFILFTNTDTKSSVKVVIPDGRYKNVNHLVRACTTELSRAGLSESVDIKHVESRGKISLQLTRPIYGVKFSEDLADIFGFNPELTYGGELMFVSPNTVNIEGGFDNLYIYSNLCENRVVGDSNVPCLHVVPTKKPDEGSFIVHDSVKNPVYVPVASLDTETVEIDIRRGDGKSVAFRGGCVIITVHIRPRV